MRFKRIKRRGEEERILPLINVVFLLLIFFMLAGRLAASDPFKVEPAQSVSETPAAAPDVLVVIGADGRLALDDAVVDEAGLTAGLSERLAETAETPTVRLKADGRVRATRVVAVMELLREAGVDKLKLLTVPKDR